MSRRAATLATAVAIVISCTTAPVTRDASGAPQRGGRFIHGQAVDISTLQPIFVRTWVTDLMYDGLIVPDLHTGEPKPHLAKWKLEPDGRTYEWDLEPAAEWSDGAPIVAADWLVAAEGIARSKHPLLQLGQIEGWDDYKAGRAPTISGITAEGKHLTVRFRTARCLWLQAFFDVLPIPAHVFGKYIGPNAGDAIDRAPENDAPTVSSGPFLFREWRRGDHVLLARNDHYWRGAPLLDEWQYTISALGQDQASMQARPHLAFFGGNVEEMAAWRARGMEIHSYPDPSRYAAIEWNQRGPSGSALADNRVRQALAYALDVENVRVLWRGEATVTRSPYPVGHWAAPTAVNDYRYDREKALALLRDAGFSRDGEGRLGRDGRPLTLALAVDEDFLSGTSVLQLAQEQYALIGIATTVRAAPSGTFQPLLRRADPSVDGFLRLKRGLGPDPGWYIGQWFRELPEGATPLSDVLGYRSAALTSVIERTGGPDCSQRVRTTGYAAVSAMLNEEQPSNFLVSPNALWAVAPEAHVVLGPWSFPFPDVHRWWLGPEKK
jgi:peptide/nickel transport system substrate-binding protein